ncbi:OmpA family protein [Flavobacterium sp.]|uniref:OmpA family protein n=1 Tax=Flavobacterium sp. TaxID=239 RepID=UPI003D6B01A9
MKRQYITLGLLLFLTAGSAQDKFTGHADKLFESYQYVDAIAEYQKLAQGKGANTYVYTQLADSYYNIFNTAEAAKWYAKAVEGKAAAETYYHYAQCLKTLGKYEEANRQMDAFAASSPNDARAKEHKLNPNYFPSLSSQSKMFDVSQTNINTKGSSDFGAVLTNDNVLYFASTRNSSKRTDRWTGQPYLDIFRSVRNSDGSLLEPEAVKELNTPFHDGPLTISADGNTMFFARDGHSEGKYDKTSQIKIGQQGLYKATKTNGTWSNAEALPFNSTKYSVTHPSLSADGKTLYFVSNMSGGLGDSDIWKVAINSNGYGAPENLGASVNTPGKENFPFITQDNQLYFASSGRQGFGGLDVFKIDLNGNTQAQNVGKPMNSEKDDFSFSLNNSLNVGYFSSNRNGSDAIYTAIPVCKAEAIAFITNKKTSEVLSNATVAILDSKGNSITTRESDGQGKVSYGIDCNTEYTFKVTLENFDTATFTVPGVKSGESVVNAALTPVEVIITDTEVLLDAIYFDFNKNNITSQGAAELDKLVKVLQDHPTMEILVKSHTDTKGSASYNLNLSERRAQSTVQYVISKGISKDRIKGKGFGSSSPKIDCGSNCSEEEHAQNRRSEFIIVRK